MAGSITIDDLKHIATLRFDIPGPGVHLLSGGNGSGKSSVLACLRRIGQPTAFAQHFSPSQVSEALDNFSNATITYELNGTSVSYSYGGSRWNPVPKANNQLLGQFGYPSVYYVGATADRITPRPGDFSPQRTRNESQDVRDTANRILGTNRFTTLKFVNLSRGNRNWAFVLQTSPPPNAKYCSEKNLSLGELCVIKLVRSLRDIANHSLVLIDELELALHPKAQIELLRYLEEISNLKHLTVIFSTHSVSLLKRVDRSRIMFLENNQGVVTTVKGCYPTYALGSIAYDEERAPDVVLYVEDDAAMYTTDMLVRLVIGQRFNGDMRAFPTVHVVPIGPFISVVRFLSRGTAMLPPTTRCSALLDQDVQTETLQEWRANNNHASLAEFQALGNQIAYLPWTPEVGAVEFFQADMLAANQKIREKFTDHRLSINHIHLQGIPVAAGVAKRDACKRAVREIAIDIARLLPNNDHVAVRKALLEIFAEGYFQSNMAQVMGLIAPRIA